MPTPLHGKDTQPIWASRGCCWFQRNTQWRCKHHTHTHTLKCTYGTHADRRLKQVKRHRDVQSYAVSLHPVPQSSSPSPETTIAPGGLYVLSKTVRAHTRSRRYVPVPLFLSFIRCPVLGFRHGALFLGRCFRTPTRRQASVS